MEWGIISAIVSVIMSIGIVLVTYGKTWAGLNVSINNLSSVVDRLTYLVDNMAQEQMQMVKEVSELKAEIRDINKRLERLEGIIYKGAGT